MASKKLEFKVTDGNDAYDQLEAAMKAAHPSNNPRAIVILMDGDGLKCTAYNIDMHEAAEIHTALLKDIMTQLGVLRYDA